MSRDDAERVVAIPEELEAVLASNPEARQVFDSLSYSHRREHAGYVAGRTVQRRAEELRTAIPPDTQGYTAPPVIRPIDEEPGA